MSNELFEISLHIVHSTDQALACKMDPDDDSEKPTWIPRSIIDNLDELEPIAFGECYELVLPLWFCEREGLV